LGCEEEEKLLDTVDFQTEKNAVEQGANENDASFKLEETTEEEENLHRMTELLTQIQNAQREFNESKFLDGSKCPT
jgi:peptide subunit release factor RF-3